MPRGLVLLAGKQLVRQRFEVHEQIGFEPVRIDAGRGEHGRGLGIVEETGQYVLERHMPGALLTRERVGTLEGIVEVA